MNKCVKTDSKDYVYDKESGALLNTDSNELDRYRASVRRAQYEQQLEQRISTLEAIVKDLQEKLANG